MKMTAWTPEEQKEHRKLWVEALRSGKYRQARGQLYKPETDGYCCLGLACELSGVGKWVGERYRTRRDNDRFELPTEVLKWLGLGHPAGAYSGGTEACLAHKNDRGASFKQIASIIESEPEGLIAKVEA